MKDLLRQCLVFVLILASSVAYRRSDVPGVEVSSHARIAKRRPFHDSFPTEGVSPLSASLVSDAADTRQAIGPLVGDTYGETPSIEASYAWAAGRESNRVAAEGDVALRDRRKRLSQELDPEPPLDLSGKMHRFLMALGGGTGLFIDDLDTDTHLGRELERRTVYQSSAVVLLLFILYYASISSGLSFLYWRLKNDSPVSYYADPRFHDLCMEGHDVTDFLSSFNTPPKSIYLQVTGLLPASGIPEEEMVDWQGEYYGIAFTFALDLTPWVVRAGRERGPDGALVQTSGLQDGVVLTDIERLHDYLTRNTNDLATVEVHKEVSWPGWEELATNIKQRIRQRGFTGVVSVHFEDKESVYVHKNKLWANFLHNQATKILMALSVFGFLAYAFYVWVRSTTLLVRARHRVDIAPDAYWRLIEHQLSMHGFIHTGAPSQLLLPAQTAASDGSSIPMWTAAGEGTGASPGSNEAEADGPA